jgi:phosphoribosylamine--glycine ligase
MLTADGPKLLEFNVRLGDPEAQAILPRLQKGEFLRLCKATANGELNNFDLNIDSKATCAVVITAEGYPDNVRKDDAIKINSDFGVINDCWIDFAGVKICNNELLTSGGRVMAVVAKGDNIEQARGIVYSELPKINYNGMYYRTDIGL